MKNSSIKSKNNEDLEQKLKYSKSQYNFKNVLYKEIILDQIFKFIEKDDIKCLSLCSKNIYQFFCNQIKKLKIKKDVKISNVSNIKFDNIKV